MKPWDTVTVKTWGETRPTATGLTLALLMQMGCYSCHGFAVNHAETHRRSKYVETDVRLFHMFIFTAKLRQFTSVACRNDIFAKNVSVLVWIIWLLAFLLQCVWSTECFDRGSCAGGICALRADITELRSGVVRDLKLAGRNSCMTLLKLLFI